MDHGILTEGGGGVCTDLRKAFDAINHELRLGKPRSYGIKDEEVEWVKDYLNNRKQVLGFPNTWIFHVMMSQYRILLYNQCCCNFQHKKAMHLQIFVNDELTAVSKWTEQNLLFLNKKRK